MLWISDEWKEYEVLDTSGGERLERWGKFILVRPDPQVIWDTPTDGTPAGSAMMPAMSAPIPAADTGRTTSFPERWQIHYQDYLTFNVKPMNFKHTGVFPEQAANWDFIREKVAAVSACRPCPGAESVCLFRRRDPGGGRRGSGGVPCGRLQGHGGLGEGKRRGLRPCRPAHPLDRGRLRQVHPAGDPPGTAL